MKHCVRYKVELEFIGLDLKSNLAANWPQNSLPEEFGTASNTIFIMLFNAVPNSSGDEF